MTNLVGQQFGKYRLIRLIDSGGFAEVYLGEHKELGTEAAIKILQTTLLKEEVKNFRAEAQTIAKLIHPHIVRVFDYGVEGNIPFMVMDYAPNGTLEKRHPPGTLVPLQTIIPYVQQIVDALQYAHNAKVIHRDIKPGNMLLGRNNEILVSDFGIAVVAHSTHSQILQDKAGTIQYMAPEQLQGKPSIASDQYSLGVVVYEWLCGTPPFEGTVLEILTQHLSLTPAPLRAKNPTIPTPVEQAVLKSLAKDPKQRFPSVQDFFQALEGAYQSQQPTILPTQPTAFRSPLPLSPTVPVASPSQGTLRLTYSGHSISVVALAWSFNGQFIASMDINQKVQVWDVATGENVFTHQNHPIRSRSGFLNWFGRQAAGIPVDKITAMEWSPCEQNIAIGSDDGIVQVWNAVAGTKVIDFHQPKSANHLTWSPDGKRIVSDSKRNLPGYSKNHFFVQLVHEVWDVTTGESLFTCHYSFSQEDRDPLEVASWSPDGQRVALTSVQIDNTINRVVEIWDAVNRGKIFVYDFPASAIAWSPDGKRIALASDGDSVQVRNTITGEPIFDYKGLGYHMKKDSNKDGWIGHAPVPPPNGRCVASGMNAITWSPNGLLLASVGGADHFIHESYYYRSLGVQVWDVKTWKQFNVYKGHSSIVRNIAWFPDMQQIISQGSEVKVWNINPSKTVFTYSEPHYIVLLSPDGTRIASTSENKTLQIWDARSGSHIFTFPGIAGGVNDMAWSPDGTRIATASGDGMVRVWQVM